MKRYLVIRSLHSYAIAVDSRNYHRERGDVILFESNSIREAVRQARYERDQPIDIPDDVYSFYRHNPELYFIPFNG